MYCLKLSQILMKFARVLCNTDTPQLTQLQPYAILKKYFKNIEVITCCKCALNFSMGE
jgi:hypothetical protein